MYGADEILSISPIGHVAENSIDWAVAQSPAVRHHGLRSSVGMQVAQPVPAWIPASLRAISHGVIRFDATAVPTLRIGSISPDRVEDRASTHVQAAVGPYDPAASQNGFSLAVWLDNTRSLRSSIRAAAANVSQSCIEVPASCEAEVAVGRRLLEAGRSYGALYYAWYSTKSESVRLAVVKGGRISALETQRRGLRFVEATLQPCADGIACNVGKESTVQLVASD